MVNEKLKKEVEILSQMCFELDEPVPFKELQLFPMKVKDYYRFYSCVSCLTIEKNLDIKGIPLSYLDYLFYLITKPEDKKEGKEEKFDGKQLGQQLIGLMESVFRIPNGFFCSSCLKETGSHEIILYKDIFEILKHETDDLERRKKFNSLLKCPHCGETMQEVFGFRLEPVTNKQNFVILNTIINSYDFDRLRHIICCQNMPDFANQEEFIDKDLEQELKLKAQLENPNYEHPSLEKQLSCLVASGISYTYEELKEITIRRMTLLLRSVDAKLHYFCYKQGEAGGMISFKEPLKHWIYSNNESKSKVTSMDSLREKLKNVSN